MAMTFEQRQAAARKAAASRRAKRTGSAYAGSTSSSTYSAPPPRQAPRPAAPYSAPLPTSRGLKLVALSAIEDCFVMRMKEQGITSDAREAFDKYQSLKRRALAPSVNVETQNEADTALRLAVVHLVKLAF